MIRPTIPLLDEVDAAVAEAAQAEVAYRRALAAVEQSKARLTEMLETGLPTLEPAQALAAATWVYWTAPMVQVKTLAFGCFGKRSAPVFTAVVAGLAFELSCSRCAESIVFTSRQSLQDARVGRAPSLCASCKEIRVAEAKAAQEAVDAAHRAERAKVHAAEHAEQAAIDKRNDLRWMPYAEYLKSDAWRWRRTEMLRHCGFRCQVCNAGGQLNVHHRTYERRGYEAMEDLLVLCAKCHDIFHREGKLAKAAESPVIKVEHADE